MRQYLEVILHKDLNYIFLLSSYIPSTFQKGFIFVYMKYSLIWSRKGYDAPSWRSVCRKESQYNANFEDLFKIVFDITQYQLENKFPASEKPLREQL